jgi:nicotinamide-nucleotide amidase
MKQDSSLRTEIMAVGSELLGPHFQDTNSLYIAQMLEKLGLDVTFKTIVGDNWNTLTLSIHQSLSRADFVIAMGGLGPTRDDRTREAFAHVLGKRLHFRQEILDTIRKRFERRGMTMPAVNKKQAYVIEGTDVFTNKNGTAPGLWLDTGSKIILLLPGPPQELKPMFEEFVLPKLEKLRSSFGVTKVLKTTGLTESEIEELIFDLYPKNPDIRMNTLAYPGQIEIHLKALSSKSKDEAERMLNRLLESILSRLQDSVFSPEGKELEEVVGTLLRIHNQTLAAAESCTGGLLGSRITDVSGSSDYFLMGVVAYSNQAKNKLLGIPMDLIEEHGAVSSEVAQAMASGIRDGSQADLGLGVTGIAGPTGGTPDKPVGLVYVALDSEEGTKVTKNLFLGNREAVKFQSSQKALDMVRLHLLKIKRT